MGMFNTIVGTCPNCGEEFESQTKLGQPDFLSLRLGDSLLQRDDFVNYLLKSRTVDIRLKDPCYHCKEPVAVRLVDGIISELMSGDLEDSEIDIIEIGWEELVICE